MRTTVRLPDDLMRQVKRLAAETDRTLTQLIEDALRATIARAHLRDAREEPFVMPTFRGDGLGRGVDLDDTASLLDLMEEDDAFH